jgi:hypothetical protein
MFLLHYLKTANFNIVGFYNVPDTDTDRTNVLLPRAYVTLPDFYDPV